MKNVSLDSSGKVELEDWVQVSRWIVSADVLTGTAALAIALRQGTSVCSTASTAPYLIRYRLQTSKGKVTVKGTAGTNATHTINEDERSSFTDHINAVGNLLATAKSF